MKQLGLTTRMVLAVSLLFVAFVAVMASLTLSFLEKEFKGELARHQFALASSLANSIDDKLRIARSALQAAATKIPPAALHDAEAAQFFLDSRVTLRSIFGNELLLLTKDGRVLAESPFHPGRRGTDCSAHEFFRDTVARNKPVISGPFPSGRGEARPEIMFTVPILDSAGRIKAILGGSIALLDRNLLDDLPAIRIGRSGYICLHASDRTIIMHTDAGNIMKKGPPPGADSLFDRSLGGFEGSEESVSPNGEAIIASHKHLTQANWALAVNYPVSEAYAPFRKARDIIVTATVAGTGAVLLMVWLLMRRLTSSLQAMTRHVQELPGKEGGDRLISIDEQGEIGILAQAFNTMIARLERQQEVLRESELNFRALAETARDGMLVIRQDGSFAFANGRAAEIFGYTETELLGLSLGELAHPDDLASVLARLRKVIAGAEVPRQYEPRLIRKDGREALVEVTSSLTSWLGEAADLIIVRDITERKRSEEVLHDAMVKYRIVADNTYDWEFWLGPDGTVIYTSPSCKRLTGHDVREYHYDPELMRRIIHPDDQPRFDSHRHDMTRVASSGDLEFRIIRADGAVRWIHHVCQPVFADNGDFLGTRGNNRDITDRKQAEGVIMALNADLQRRATELAAVNQELASFGYSLSHDLKTPLTAVYLAAQELTDLYAGRLDETGNFFIKSICQSSERMIDLIESMLLLARVTQSLIQHEEVDLSGLAKKILLRLQMEQSERTVECVVAAGITAVGDARLLESALENLLGNAWKYTVKAPIARIEFGVVVQEGEQRHYVRDNGIGFSMEHAKKLFLPFSRLHRPEEFKGSGIGLATVQRIVQRHGGRIWAESEPGKGTTFFFTLGDP